VSRLDTIGALCSAHQELVEAGRFSKPDPDRYERACDGFRQAFADVHGQQPSAVEMRSISLACYVTPAKVLA
jgi:hypothetical protein